MRERLFDHSQTWTSHFAIAFVSQWVGKKPPSNSQNRGINCAEKTGLSAETGLPKLMQRAKTQHNFGKH